MEARLAPLAACLVAAFSSATLEAATYRTPNFEVHAPTDEIAKQVGEAAEFHRRELAIEWLGKPLPRWYRPCPITVKVGQIGAGGATTFTFEGGEVFGWNMKIQGSVERILDSVVPHEVSHTIFACYFRQPLPRWADEGAATLVEHESERLRQTKHLEQVLRTPRRIPLKQLLAIKEYPQDMQQVLTLYAEGYSLADFLVQHKGEQGKPAYLAFLKDAIEKNWSYAFRKHYGYESLEAVEQKWTGWIVAGSPPLKRADGALLADNGARTAPARPQPPAAVQVAAAESSSPRAGAVRGQSPPASDPLPMIARPLRTRPRGRELSAPEPNITAMPARLHAHPEESPWGDAPGATADSERGLPSAAADSALEFASQPGDRDANRDARATMTDRTTPRHAELRDDFGRLPRPRVLGDTTRLGSVSDAAFSP
jgi:hypothetical protein